MKEYIITIELQTIEIKITAKNKAEARKKALAKLNKRKPHTLIDYGWMDGKRKIDIDEL